ncbi:MULTISPECIES: hypothetical protein [Streptomyces]|uniref:hypothetical protein n=1 Tax=Streptomyces TaxID=1883 RepID=UPI000C3A0B80|nr:MULTISPECIES: hypothetical protein [Streptomyces]PIB06249.1 hypothetical protein B1C81_25855 [Streptomyces sp. HG99]
MTDFKGLTSPPGVLSTLRTACAPGRETPSAREIKAARADVRCKEETGVVAVWSAAETRIQRTAIAAHSADFRALTATREAHLTAARRVVDTAGR